MITDEQISKQNHKKYEKAEEYNYSKAQSSHNNGSDSEGDETSISELKRMMIKMINEIKQDIQNKSMKLKRI